MSLEHHDEKGFILTKGTTVPMIENGKPLDSICIGVNWGAIKATSGLQKLIRPKKGVDLDASAAMFQEDGKIFDVVYYSQLRSKEGALQHSGDDVVGDEDEDDDDNEVIYVNLSRVNPIVRRIVFFINSYKEDDFCQIPYSRIRMFKGTPNRPGETFATFNLSSEEAFKDKVAMVMGRLNRQEDQSWVFQAIGKPLNERDIQATLEAVKKYYA